jgi:hypothetical protein
MPETQYLKLKQMFPQQNSKNRILWIIHKIMRKIKNKIYMIDAAFNFLLYNKKVFKTEISICSMIKNEANFINEWIEFHKLVGVQKFYLYDNESDDNTKEILEPYIEKKEVIYHIVKNFENPDNIGHFAPQREAFWHCIKHYRNKTKFLAVLDCDEFLVPTMHSNLQEALEEISNLFFKNKIFSGVCCRWVMFGTSGHNTKPDGLVIENYRKRFRGSNPFCKSIVNPRTCKPGWVHTSEHYFNLYAVDQEGNNFQKKYLMYDISFAAPQVFSLHNPSAYNESEDAFIRCYHYYTKSYEEYKIRRMNNVKGFGKMKVNAINDYVYEVKIPPFQEFADKWGYLEIEDTEMLHFLKPLKESLHER